MKELTNIETYKFISEELTYHPELSQFSAKELAARKDDKKFWYDLMDELDCFRICDVCGEPMLDGFLVRGDNHYCSEKCLHTVMTEEEYLNDCEEYGPPTMWTTWFDNSLRYIE